MSIVSELATMLKTEMEANPMFPFSDRRNFPPSKQFKPHMLNVALKNNPILRITPDMEYFEIGNDYAEEKAPQYHILEDARTIKNPYRGKPQTLGSQRKVKEKKDRDYGKNVFLNKGETFKIGQEYRQSFRGRSNIWRTNLSLAERRFERRFERMSFRYNTHYGYIERILEEITPRIADFIGAELRVGSSMDDVELLTVSNNEESKDVSKVFNDVYASLFKIEV